MRENGAPDIESLLHQEGRKAVPQPRPDLARRTIERIRHWVVVGDLLRLATLEGVWDKLRHRGEDAQSSNERQDPYP